MDIKVTVGVTPSLEKILFNLTDALNVLKDKEQTKQNFETQVIPIQQPVQTIPNQQQSTASNSQPVKQQPKQPEQPQAVPTSSPTYTIDQLAVAATQLMDAGKREELVQLLNSFGVQALTALPKEQYGAFATKLRELGAKI